MADNPLGGVSEKLGKLPPMAIVAVVGGALAIAYFTNRSNGNSAAVPVAVPEEAGMGGMSPGWISTGPPTNNPTTPGYQDNEAWGSAAVGWLIGYGIGAVEAGTAVRKYLNSDKLTQREKNLIDLVSKKAPDGIGPPPNIPAGGGVDDPAPIPNTPTPTTPTPTTPTPAGPIAGWNGRVFQVKKWPQPGSSLWTISGLVYGAANQTGVNKIYNANRDRISNPNIVHPGQWLRIP